MRRRNKRLLIFCGSLILLCGCKEEEEWYIPVENHTEQEELLQLQETAEITDEILVYVCGAVEEPGVVALHENSRVVDAITAAGGFTADAAQTYLNLAKKLQDGEKIYVPTVTEEALLKEEERVLQLIDINAADVKELCELPGIGESKAIDIIAYREKEGPFQKKEDLMKVPGIKENLYEKIADKIIVN